MAIKSNAHYAGGAVAPTLRYRDVRAAIDWLCEAFGFEERRVLLAANGAVQYAELAFGDGMILLGTAEDPSIDQVMTQPETTGGLETQICYLFIADANAHYARAKAAGAEIVLDMVHENSNGRGYSCRDLEGHIWNFGTYDPRQGQFPKGCGSERYQVVQRPRIGPLVLFADLLINAMTSIALIALAYLASEHALSSAHASASSKRTATGPEVQPMTSVAWAIKDVNEQLVRERNARDAAVRNARDAREQLAEERGAREAAERAATDAQDQLASELSNRAGLELALAELRKTAVSHEAARPKTSLPGSPEEKGDPVVGIRIERMPNKYINLDGYKIHSGKTYAQCEQLCLAERKCVAIEFDRQSRTCELLDQLAPPLADAEADIGIKRFH